MQRIFLPALLLVSLLLANPVAAQQPAEAKEMTIGSTAPPIDIEHWVSTGNGQFEQFNEFESGKVYVVEFWATWCGPCVASMPHLADLQKKYAEQGVTVVSVSDEPLETVEKFLEREVMGAQAHAPGEEASADEAPQTYADLTSVYCLTTDPDGSVKNDYFRAAGQRGIPCAFIVGKDGVVEWIGHPMAMDEPLEQIVTDSWDREAFAEAFRAKQQLEKLFQSAAAAAQQGDYDAFDTAVAEIEALKLPEDMAGRVPMMLRQLDQVATMTMLSNDPERAIARMNEQAAGMNLMQATNLGAQIMQQNARGKEIKPEVVDAVIAIIEEKSDADKPVGAVFYTLAGLYHAKGDLDKAIELQEQAVAAPATGVGARAARFQAAMQAFLKKLQDEKGAGAEEESTEEAPAESNG